MSSKITDLSAETTPASGDLVAIVDVSDLAQSTGGSTNKMTYANFVAGILAEQGITSTVAELNILDGATLSVAELNLLDGVTSSTAELNLLDGKALAGSDSNILTGTPGTNGDLAQWDANGDLIDSATPPSGVILGTTDTQTLSNKRITKRVTTITSSGTPTINTDNCDVVTITALAAAITSMTTNLSGTPTNFQPLIFRILDDGTARAITWGSKFQAMGVALPTTTTISKVLTVGFLYDTVDSKWGCVAVADEA